MSNPNVQPLAQDFVIAAQVPDPVRFFFHDPDLTRLDDGTLLLAAPQWHRPGWDYSRRLRLLRSDDGGLTWVELPGLPYEEATPFVLDGRLLMFVQEKCHKDFLIVASDDRGETWSDPRTVIEGPIWNISTSRVLRPEAVYWAMDWDLPDHGHGGKTMLRLDRSMPPLDPGAWTLSNIVRQPEIPAAMTRNLFPDGNRPQLSGGWRDPLVWLEPNTVEVRGRIRAFCRCVFDEYAAAHIAAVFDYDPDANRMSFTQFAAWPGAQCKFYIIHDHSASMYWMLSNLITNSQDLLGWAEKCGSPDITEARETNGGGSISTMESTASTGFRPVAWPAGPTTSTAASCIPAPSWTGTISWYSRAPAGTRATSMTPTSVPSTAFETTAVWPWTSTLEAFTDCGHVLARISRYASTVFASPISSASPISAWPIETSRTPGMEQNLPRFSRFRSCPALTPRPAS